MAVFEDRRVLEEVPFSMAISFESEADNRGRNIVDNDSRRVLDEGMGDKVAL